MTLRTAPEPGKTGKFGFKYVAMMSNHLKLGKSTQGARNSTTIWDTVQSARRRGGSRCGSLAANHDSRQRCATDADAGLGQVQRGGGRQGGGHGDPQPGQRPGCERRGGNRGRNDVRPRQDIGWPDGRQADLREWRHHRDVRRRNSGRPIERTGRNLRGRPEKSGRG